MHTRDDYARLLATQTSHTLRVELERRGHRRADEVNTWTRDQLVGVLAIYGHDDEADQA